MAPLRIYLAGNVALEQGELLMPERALPGRQGRLALALRLRMGKTLAQKTSGGRRPN